VRFRYKLDGVDREWREVVNERKVQYSNLGPGTYRFHVKACNNSGLWNETGDTLEFLIPPMWYQTNWFFVLCAATFLALLWAAYRLRVRQLAHEFNMRLEERVGERTRIARDLHDTLLQSFQGLLPLLQASINIFTSRPAEALKTLEKATDYASQAITEGRDAIAGLRISTVEKNDLALAIEAAGEEIAAAQDNAAKLQVLVEGTSRELHPILRDEVYRVATEALRNAFRHAVATNVEAEIRYDVKYFRLRVRDDGKGIDTEFLRGDGREGHYGLHGMRERARLAGGKLTIWTEVDNGTEIELIIPAAKAYLKSTRPFWYFGKRSATETDDKETIERE
jgi:signal transduction histidine kinase